MYMKKLLYLTIVALLFFVSRPTMAQQDAQITQYMLNPLYYNPAYSGIKGVTEFTILHRSQWLGYQTTFDGRGGAPSTQNVNVSKPFPTINSGVGLNIIRDRVGPQISIEALVSYAYHIKFGNNTLSIGLRGGIYALTLDGSKYKPLDENDPLIPSGKESQIKPDMGAGVFMKGKQYFAGISLNHVIQSSFDFGIDDFKNVLANHFYVMGGYTFDISPSFGLTPTALVKTDFKEYSFDAGAMAEVLNNRQLRFGASYRLQESVSLMIGYSFFANKSLDLGYAFDYTIDGQDAKDITSHEIILRYFLFPPEKIPIRTPRFRH